MIGLSSGTDVRQRLTALYAVVFLLSGLVLLGLTFALVGYRIGADLD